MNTICGLFIFVLGIGFHKFVIIPFGSKISEIKDAYNLSE